MNLLPQELQRVSHVYKVVDGKDLCLDVIGPHDPGGRRPGVMWIHGGGLIFGSRKSSPRDSLLQALTSRGFVVVSIDHRLAPETKLPDIVDDVRDAWRWLHETGPSCVGVAAENCAILGASAGGYLALMGGYLFDPRPAAVASFFGFGDITASWEADPSPYYCSMDLVTREQALESLRTPPPEGLDRSTFYLYCRQQGRWLPEVTANDPRESPGWFDRYCPVRNVTPRFPPTILVHGTDDNDVPHEESAKLAQALSERAVRHRFLSLPGIGHGFANAQPTEVQRVEGEIADFLRSIVISGV